MHERLNNPFDYTPDAACEAAYRKLLRRIEALATSGDPADASLCRELSEGKMLGVLIAEDAEGTRHELYAFSGQLGEYGFKHPDFVGPVFDYLAPDGYFKLHEADISRQNAEIARFEREELREIQTEHDCLRERHDAELAAFKERCRLSKRRREERRAAGNVGAEEEAAMIRQSQFEKAETRRLKQRLAAEEAPYTERLREARARLEGMKASRHADSEALQEWLFSNFRLLNARGETRSLRDIFADTPVGVPPSGAGECCAPKLLQTAYLRGWRPVAMAEYWYGKPKRGEVRRHGHHYPACRGKCLPILRWMLQGIDVEPPLGEEYGKEIAKEPEILYENEWFCVVDKPAGMLSVPGKGRAPSVQTWLEACYGTEKRVKVAHRLDQDTSGLLVAAFGDDAYKLLQSLFASRQVEKTYVADLDGDYRELGLPESGRISLPLAADWLDRPRQRVDFENGKEAVTDYAFLGVEAGRSRVEFRPHTGRTHQLRVHAASDRGLALPIVGDPLYGARATDQHNPSSRLHLHAHRLDFTLPLDGLRYTFESPVPF